VDHINPINSTLLTQWHSELSQRHRWKTGHVNSAICDIWTDYSIRKHCNFVRRTCH